MHRGYIFLNLIAWNGSHKMKAISNTAFFCSIDRFDFEARSRIAAIRIVA